MKKTYLLIGVACLFAVSCTRQTQIIRRNNPPQNVQKTQLDYKKQNTTNINTTVVKVQNGKNLSGNKTKKVIFAPVVTPSYKNSSYYNPKSVKVFKTKGKIQISVEKMPLNEFLNLVFGKTLQMSYFLDSSVARRKDLITIKMEKPESYDKFLETIYGILSRYNISVQKKGNTVFIVPGRVSQQIRVSQYIIGRKIPSSISGSETIAAIIPFYYVKASTYQGLIRKLALSQQAQLGVIPNTNSLTITDKASNIREAIKIINLFDRLTFVHKSVVIIPLDYLDPSTFIKKLKKILPLEGIPIATDLQQPGIVMISMPEISSVIVVTPKKEWISVISFWKDKLDTISALGDSPRFFVYYPQNRRASDLAQVFSQINSSITFSKKKKVVKKSNVFSLKNNVKVIVDEGRNALVILAPPSEYEQIKNVLNSLDTLPKEVLVQVTIAEITLTNKLQYGIEWYLKHSGKYTGVLQTLGGLGLGASGINYSLISDTGKFQALLNAYAHKNLINVISSPRLVVLDNHNATINVGTQVPTVTSETNSDNIQSQGTTSLLRTISYRDTGVILNIRPTINSGGILTLNIHQEVSEPQVNDTSKIDSPLILNRDITTSVILRSGSTLLLGGLIKKNKSSTINKVPILGDIPILGNLFKTTSKGTTKTELIIEITPYIISNMEEAKERTKKFESLIKWFKGEDTATFITK